MSKTFGKKGVASGGKPREVFNPQKATILPQAKKKQSVGLLGVAVFGLVIVASMLAYYVSAESKEEAEVRLVAEAKMQEEQQEAIAAAERDRLKAEKIANRPPLVLSSFRCQHENGFTTIQGEITNRSDRPIDNLMAVGLYQTSSRELVKHAEAMIEYQPLMPGQRSPFRTMATYNPVATDCGVGFKTMFGAAIPYDIK